MTMIFNHVYRSAAQLRSSVLGLLLLILVLASSSIDASEQASVYDSGPRIQTTTISGLKRLKPSEHEKIGLVLSGGAARGLAHIGVLRALEENDIKVHAIAGTSFGAIIGGLYASGYKADEIEQIAKNLDWAYALSDEPKRSEYSYRRKQEDFNFLVKGRLTLKNGEVRFPTGLLQGQQLQLVLNKLFAHVATVNDFDNLAIPFRAVATDIATGSEVVLKQGNVARAVKASMTIPGLISPEDLGGRLLVDGGIANNIPISVVRDMGVDRIIAVDIGAPLYNKDELTSVFSVLDQLSNFLTRGNSSKQIELLGDKDLLISPKLEGISGADFSKVNEAVTQGYAAAALHAERLAEFTSAQGKEHELIASRSPMIDFVTVENDSLLSDKIIRKSIRQRQGKPLNQAQLEEDITSIYALGYFETVSYEFVQRKSATGLKIIATDKYRGTDYIQLGLHLADDFDGDNSYYIAGSYRKNAVNKLGGEWFTRLQLGEDMEVRTEFFQPLSYEHLWFVEPSLSYEAENIAFVQDNQQLGEYRVKTHTAALGLGRMIGRTAEMRFGFERSIGRAGPRIGVEELQTVEFDDAHYFARFSYDSLNSIYFPTEGQRYQLTYRQSDTDMGADLDFGRLELDATAAFSYGSNSIALGLELLRSYSLDQQQPQYGRGIGGFLRLSGLQPNAVVANDLLLARAVYFRRISRPSALPLDVPFYFGASAEYGNAWHDNDIHFNDLRAAGSLFIGVDTPLGPLYLSYGRSEDNQRSINLFLGQIF